MKLYITDLDGTFLDNNAKVPKLTEELTNSLIEQGVMFTYATARSIHSAAPLLTCVNFKLPVITHNGAFIYNPETSEPIVSNTFGEEKSAKIKEYFSDKPDSLLVYAYINGKERVSYLSGNINEGVRRYIDNRKTDKRLRECHSFDSLFEGDIYYITLISPATEKSVLDEFFCADNGFAVNYQGDTYKTDELWYEIFRSDVSKANAVLKLKEMLGADEVITFGDNINDISMLKAADRGYAVANAGEEVKKSANGVIRSNFQSGVPLFIALDNAIIRDKPVALQKADNKRFKECVGEYQLNPESGGIGTLREKQTHAVLKRYFSSTDYDREIKLGKYYADCVTENGIIEIQTQGFKALLPKLEIFLQCSHVTVVYPYKKKTRLSYIDKKTGEVIKVGYNITHSDLNDFFIELYRIKRYLNHPNLTICIANLKVEEYRFCGKDLKRRKSDIKKSVPDELISLEYLCGADDYKRFIPKDLPESFTLKEFGKLCKNSQPTLALSILKFMGLVDYSGKNGKEIIYRLCTDNKTL